MNKSNKFNITFDSLKLFIDKNLSQKEIAEQFNCSISTIQFYSRKYKLKVNKKPPVCKICNETDKTKFITENYSMCKACSVKRGSRYIVEKKKKLIELKGGKCQKCGYDKYYGALEFHHIDPNEKDIKFNNKFTFVSLDKALTELNKCILLCANCHREIHSKEFSNGNN